MLERRQTFSNVRKQGEGTDKKSRQKSGSVSRAVINLNLK